MTVEQLTSPVCTPARSSAKLPVRTTVRTSAISSARTLRLRCTHRDRKCCRSDRKRRTGVEIDSHRTGLIDEATEAPAGLLGLLAWRKSAASNPNGDCVELAPLPA